MTALILDAGALIALDRNDRGTWAILKRATDDGDFVGIPAGVLAQVWRDGSRQARLAATVNASEDLVLDGEAARIVGVLCGETGVADVVDGSVAIEAAKLAQFDDVAVLTSDPGDIEALLTHLSVDATVVRV